MRTSHRLMTMTTGLVVALSLAGCGGSGGSASGDGAGANPVGTWGSTADQQPNLTLASDGSVSGTDGCNRLIGKWTQDGATVDLGALGSTLMACQGVDTWLSGARTATVDGDTLVVKDEGGAEIGKLERSSDK